MWKKIRVKRRLDELDEKLHKDDLLIRKLGDVVIQLRVVTRQTESILRELQGDVAYDEYEPPEPTFIE